MELPSNSLEDIKNEGYMAGYEDNGMICPYEVDSMEEFYWYSGYGEALDDYSRSFDI